MLYESGQVLWTNILLSFLAMPNLRSRIKEVLSVVEGDNQAELARLAEVTRSAVGQWVSGKTKEITARPAFQIQDKLGFSARWLADGTLPKKVSKKMLPEEGTAIEREGRILKLYYINALEDQLLQAFRRVPDELQEVAVSQVAILIPKNKGGDAEVLQINPSKKH